jgi:hypothetical protein
MAYKIKNSNLAKSKAFHYQVIYEELDDEAYIQYNSRFHNLTTREKTKIALKVARERGHN